MSAAGFLALSMGWMLQAPAFSPPPLWEHDGKSWGGIKLGVHKDGDIKRLFGGGKGGIRPESLRIPSSDPSVRVDALLDARGAKAVVRAVRLEFSANPPTLEEASEKLGVQATLLYQPDRWEDWSIAAFPGKGICTLLLEGKAWVWLLGDPDLMDRSLRVFSNEVTDVVERPDPGANWDRIVTYESVRVRVQQSKTSRVPDDLDSRGRRRLESDIEAKMLRVVRGAALYGMGGGGSFVVDVTIGAFNDKGESQVQFSAFLAADTPYGPLSVTKSHSLRMQDDYRRRLSDGADHLLRLTLSEAAAKIDSLGPPPMNSKRMAAQEALMEMLTPEIRTP